MTLVNWEQDIFPCMCVVLCVVIPFILDVRLVTADHAT